MTMEQRLADSIRPRRVNMILLGTFAALALAPASVGIYGVVSYSVAQRTHEIGVRMALGALEPQVFRAVLGHTLGLSLVGVSIGLATALAMSWLIASLLFGIKPGDLLTLAVATAFMFLVGILACYVPARRSTRVDPMIALRCE